jgi:hypothetical protein
MYRYGHSHGHGHGHRTGQIILLQLGIQTLQLRQYLEHMCTNMQIYIRIHAYSCRCVSLAHEHIYTHTHTHTHTHTNIIYVYKYIYIHMYTHTYKREVQGCRHSLRQSVCSLASMRLISAGLSRTSLINASDSLSIACLSCASCCDSVGTLAPSWCASTDTLDTSHSLRDDTCVSAFASA